MLIAWSAAYAAMTWHGHMHSTDSTSGTFAGQPSHDLLQMSEKYWFSHANVSKRVYASAAESNEMSAVEAGSYFRILTRMYGTSIDHAAPGNIATAAAPDEPMPLDDVAKFHQLETHAPIARARVTSEFGHRTNPFGKNRLFHRGIDLAAPTGTPVFAVAAGTVVRATSDRTYGNVVVIDHHNGYKTLYAHNARLLVKVGERVKVGQQIAKVGSTGRSTGPHLHFEIHRSGQRVDPAPYLVTL